MHERVFLGLGANLGDRETTLRTALAGLAGLPGTQVVRVSTIIETEPWGYAAQPCFLNAVAELRTELEPPVLLEHLQRLERAAGRVPGPRWGPRTLDLDLLLYGRRCWRTPELTLPHPHLLERPFVVEPLAEIAPEIVEELRRAAVSL
jgi:2-amino-4-hydroxy-6-hydroxymethyldihydropteridine diphosphokinase